ncbi:unnamed protein product, partial [Allacma fusca]
RPSEEQPTSYITSFQHSADPLEQELIHIDQDEDKVQLKLLKKKQTTLRGHLKRLKNAVINSRKYRKNKKRKIEEVLNKHPELAAELEATVIQRPGSGSPRLDESQPMLLKTIVDIVAPESCTDQRRRMGLLNSCKTLDDLRYELERRGNKFIIKC